MVVSLQIMDSRNDKPNNQYELRNRKHSNRNDGLSISGQRSGDQEEGKEEEDGGNHPHQRCHVGVDKADNEDAGEVMEVPRVIDFERFPLNPD